MKVGIARLTRKLIKNRVYDYIMVVLYFINIQSYMDKEETLPSLTLYRRNCQASK